VKKRVAVGIQLLELFAAALRENEVARVAITRCNRLVAIGRFVVAIRIVISGEFGAQASYRDSCPVATGLWPAEVGRNLTFLPCFLGREWKILWRALDLAIQIPQR